MTTEGARTTDAQSAPADASLSARIEQALLNAWPALHQVLHDGWLLRFCGGFTKRANSVSIVYSERAPNSADRAERIRFCEDLYRQQGLVPIFRLTDNCPDPALDAALAARDYRLIDATDVLIAPTEPQHAREFPFALERAHWLAHYSRLSGSPASAEQLHRLLLQAIRLPSLCAVLRAGDAVVACGLAVRERDLVGLFDVVTDPDQRRRGYGERLTAGLMAWGAQSGASTCYLQVVQTNVTARRLYERLGFAQQHRYWYRVASA